MEIETERLRLRPLKATDKQSFIAMYIDEDMMALWPKIYTIDEAEAVQNRNKNDPFVLAITEKDNDDFIGYISLKKREEKPDVNYHEIGWLIWKTYQGKGYATEAAKAFLEYIRYTHNINEVIAITSKQHYASIRIMEKLGMVFQYEYNDPRIEDNNPLNPCVVYAIRK